MRLEKIKDKDILDVKHITEISELTGEVTTYSKNIYTKEGIDKLNNNAKLKLSVKELHRYLNDNIGNFFFYFYNKLDEVDISPQYKVRFLYLASYLDYNNDDIISRGKYNVKIRMNRQNLKDILKLSDSEFRKTLKALTDNKLIYEQDKHYKLNISCTIKGNLDKSISDYTRIFIETIRNLYIKTPSKNHKQLYYIFKILPHVNLQFNIPCKNIDCDVLNEVVPLNLSEICDILGMDSTNRNRLWKFLRGFEIDGNYMLCKHEVDDLNFICINPRLFYAGTRIENIEYMVNVFDMAKKVKS